MKYKLIKEYPGSPNLGCIITKNSNKHECGSYRFIPSIIEDYPEFWEKVFEKDYEVLSLINTYEDKTIITYENGGGCYNKTELSTIYKTKGYWIECFTQFGNPWKIYSIKRLSDSAAFTLGDKITDGTQEGIILKLRLTSDNKFQFTCSEKERWIDFNDSWKVKESIFVTYDEVDMFMGDDYYTLGTPDNYWSIQKFVVNVNCLSLSPIGKIQFSTLEAAEKYILDNKPKRLYTEDEMVRALENWGMCRVDISYVNEFLNK